MAGTPPPPGQEAAAGHVASDPSPVDAMCEVTGGRSYAVTSQRVLHQCIDSLVQKLQSGVVVHFEKMGADPPPAPGEKDKDRANEDDEVCALSRADTVPLDEDVEVLNAKGLTFNGAAKTGAGAANGGGGGDSNSRPHTPNPILSSTNTAWHSCRRLIYVTRSAQKGERFPERNLKLE